VQNKVEFLMADIADEKVQNVVDRLANDLGTEFFKQTIIVLTFANSVKPPQTYYNDAINIVKESGKPINRTEIELMAWREYTSAIKQ